MRRVAVREILILAGEASGDLHGAILAERLRALRPDLALLGTGGTRMRAAGVEMLEEHEGVVGFVERVAIDAPEGEPLRLELESFVAALRGEVPVAVTGRAGRDALAVALRIVTDIERSLPTVAAHAPGRGA